MLEELWRVKLGYFDFFPAFSEIIEQKRHWINCWKPLIWSRLDYDSDIGHWTKNSSGAHCPPVKKQLTVGRTDSWPVNSWLNLLTSENKLRAWSQRGFQRLRKMKILKVTGIPSRRNFCYHATAEKYPGHCQCYMC